MQINGLEESVGLLVPCDLDPARLVLMVQNKDLFADQRQRGFIEFSVERDGPVFGNPAPGGFSKVILEFFWSRP